MQGNYLSQDSISVLTISDKGAIRTYDFALKISLDSAQKKYRLDGDTLTDLTTGKKELVILAGDTVLGRSSGIDTVFYISPANVLKKYKGYYFLNALYDKNAWTLRRLSLSGGILSISEIADTAHINQLKEITETAADTICTNFKMSQAQFRKFVSGNGFDQTERFTRLSGK
jgi:hypothetical protein